MKRFLTNQESSTFRGKIIIMRLIVSLIITLLYTSQLYAEFNPFEKKVIVDIGTEAAWKISDGVATKTGKDRKGQYYQLFFDKKQLRITLTRDQAGNSPKSFPHFEVKDVLVDGDRLPLFDWCLNHQSSHNRFLQHGLTVKNNVCVVDGEQGEFVLWLNQSSLKTIANSRLLSFVLKPYRTPVEVNYDLSDFKGMQQALLPVPVVKTSTGRAVKVDKPVAAAAPAKAKTKTCHAKPPAKYKNIKPVPYPCGNSVARKNAETSLAGQLEYERSRQQQLKKQQLEKQQAAQKQKQILAQQEKQRKAEEARRLQQEQERKLTTQQLEDDALAASTARQSELGTEITIKMVSMCQKYWSKGEHRCYCQKFIEYAPAEIQAKSTCK